MFDPNDIQDPLTDHTPGPWGCVRRRPDATLEARRPTTPCPITAPWPVRDGWPPRWPTPTPASSN